MNDREIEREIPFEEKAVCFKENVSNYFSDHANNGGDTNDPERLLIHEGYRAVLAAEKTIQLLQSDLAIEKQANDHAKEVLERLQKITNRATDRAMKAYAELHDAKAKNKALQMDNAQLQSDVINANMNADHAMAENARLCKIAGAMHTWIFLHTGDEEKAYKECGLTDEDNAMLGYIGKIELDEQEGDTE